MTFDLGQRFCVLLGDLCGIDFLYYTSTAVCHRRTNWKGSEQTCTHSTELLRARFVFDLVCFDWVELDGVISIHGDNRTHRDHFEMAEETGQPTDRPGSTDGTHIDDSYSTNALLR